MLQYQPILALDINLALGSIKHKLWNILWRNLKENFDPANLCTPHIDHVHNVTTSSTVTNLNHHVHSPSVVLLLGSKYLCW